MSVVQQDLIALGVCLLAWLGVGVMLYDNR